MFSRQFIRLATRSLPKARQLSSQVVRKTSRSPFLMLALSGVAGGAVMLNLAESAPNTVDIKAVKKDIADAIDAEFERRGDGTSMAGTLIRLAWHASGTYSKEDDTGGSNGATMRFAPEAVWGANAGLGSARDFLVPIKNKYPGLSYADLWTLAGAVAVEEMGGPEIPWKAGRVDSLHPTTVPDGRLPAADSGCVAADVKHLRTIFHRMGFTDKEIVCLTGAHAVGRCHENASGYWGPWTNAETTFSNEYFRLLIEEKWAPKKTHKGKKWTGPAQLEDRTGSLMMLPADMTMVRAPEFRPFVEAYAADEELFFKDFAAAFSKLLALGVKFPEEKKKGFFSNLFGF